MRCLPLLLLLFSPLFATEDVAVIDLHDFHNPERRAQFVEGLKKAFSDNGFVAVLHPELDRCLMERACLVSSRFFAQKKMAKMRNFDFDLCGQRGYTPGETAKGERYKDYKEYYSFGREYSKEVRKRYGYPENIWPCSCGFREAHLAFYGAIEKNAAYIEEALGEALELPKGYFQRLTDEGDTLCRVIHYYRNPPEGVPWSADHHDINLFSMLPPPTCYGLQFLSSTGDWVDVRVPEEALIVHAGDMLENLTNGSQTHTHTHTHT